MLKIIWTKRRIIEDDKSEFCFLEINLVALCQNQFTWNGVLCIHLACLIARFFKTRNYNANSSNCDLIPIVPGSCYGYCKKY